MRIAVIGAGAMGSIYGGHLSLHNEVYLVDTNQAIVDHINQNGLILQENGEDVVYHPTACISTAGLEKMDLVILFVKALFSQSALNGNKGIIGPDTYLMTLQNGSGHEDILGEFAPINHIIIGTTNDNGALLAPGHVRHGGEGETNIGMLAEDTDGFLPKLKATLDECGFKGYIHENIQQLIWNKLFTNVSLSALTGVLQVPMGFIAGNEHAWTITKQLIHEAVEVAHGLGLEADEAAITEKVKHTSEGSPEGITSICADLRDGRRTEVNTISGSVVRAAKKCGVPAPTHELIVELVHAMEDKAAAARK
jgi:2-dehydropantoate 2-reductase